MLLHDLEGQRERFYPELQPLLDELKSLRELPDRARVRGQISGVYRRYRAELVALISSWAIAQTPGAEPTKFLVTRWQKETFGHALSNSRLAALWCDPRRSAGERGSLPITERTTALASEVYELYSQALDQPLDMEQLEQLSATLLEGDLGL
nr:hypothetical protein [Pseudomonas juntendi]